MMARRRLLLLGAVLTMIAAGAEAEAAPPPQAAIPAAARYFPDHAWAESSDFMESWFGNQLRAMDEPVLARATTASGYRRRFRMLVLPAFHPAYAVRAEEGTASGRIHVVRLDGNGGFAPGRIAERETYRVDRDQMRLIDRAIASSGVLDLPPDFEPPPDADEIMVCLDGVRFVFEIVDPESTRVVTRHACELTPGLRRLIRFIDDLRVDVGSDLARYLN